METPQIPANEAVRLQRLQSLRLLDTEAEAVLDSFTELAAAITGMPIALISLVDADRQWFKSAVGLQQGDETSRDISFCGHAILGDGVFEVSDATADPRFFDNPLTTGGLHVTHYAGVPLEMPGGERIGTVCVISNTPGTLDARARLALENIARSVVRVLLLRDDERHAQHAHRLVASRTLADMTPVGMFSADRKGAVTFANDRWLAKLGLAELSDGLGWGWTSVIDPEDGDGFVQDWVLAAQRGARFDQTFRTSANAGPVRWLRMRAELAEDSQGDFRYVGVLADVTERQGLLEELRMRNDLLEMVLESMPDGLVVFDERRRHVICNDRQRELLDLPPHVFEAEGATLDSILAYMAYRGDFGPGDMETHVATRIAASAGPGRYIFEDPRPSGRTVETHVNHLPNGWRIQVTTDISKRKVIEDELRAQREQLEMALDSSALGFWEYSPLTDRIMLSDGWARTFGFDGALEGPTRDLSDLVPPDAVPTLVGGMVALMKGKVPRLAIEYRQADAHGGFIWVRNEAKVAERGADGRALRVIGTIKDISDIKQAEQALKDALAKAEKASRAKGDFLATMSHEIRTPINGVIGLSRMLGAEPLPPRQARYVGLIDSCAKTLLALVDNVLDFSKIEAGQMGLERAQTNLHALLRETCDIFEARAADKGLRFGFSTEHGLPAWIVTDPLRLRQILLNLLGNALKFTERGEIALCVRLDREDGFERLQLGVRDSGIGMTPEQQARLFQRFAQADVATSRKFKGTGLGLAISRQLAQLMGGDIGVTSAPGAGSTFTVTVPLERAGAPAAAHQALPDRRGRADALIVLAEDDPINQMVAQAVLEELGYCNVRVVENGRDAVEVCRGSPVALVLMDCQMPAMDGFEATTVLRQGGFQAPIVALTAGATLQDRLDCLAVGMNDYLSKPMEPASLADALNRWLPAEDAVEAPA